MGISVLIPLASGRPIPDLPDSCMNDQSPDYHIVPDVTPESWFSKVKTFVTDLIVDQNERSFSKVTFVLGALCLALVAANGIETPVKKIVSPVNSDILKPLQNPARRQYEVFGFAPFWTLSKLENVDFTTLSTLAYFGVPVTGDGTLDREDIGYTRFHSMQATELFKKAHKNGTRVVLTITQMKNHNIEAILDSEEAQEIAISQTVEEVRKRGIDGINVDFEYVGNPGYMYRQKFSKFVANMTARMHQTVPGSRVTVSVYASAARSPKLYDIASLGKSTDGVFMMAYDFAVSGSEKASPTAPLYGYKEGKYSYDIATAVKDFLKEMPSEKLILGVPYYGYNYPVGSPKVNASTYPSWYWNGDRATQTYQVAQENVNATVKGDEEYQEGWDQHGQVGWRAYKSSRTNTWRMIFLDDSRSLAVKYDFAKSQNLAGVGMWALGFDDGRTELWDLLRVKFGPKLADSSTYGRVITEGI